VSPLPSPPPACFVSFVHHSCYDVQARKHPPRSRLSIVTLGELTVGEALLGGRAKGGPSISHVKACQHRVARLRIAVLAAAPARGAGPRWSTMHMIALCPGDADPRMIQKAPGYDVRPIRPSWVYE